ncbi:MAG: hypothetical protein J6L47_02605 [Alphaproteobacteria bacterium]|nr:hypothetical protein [Alphaproteobacteria bacterium]
MQKSGIKFLNIVPITIVGLGVAICASHGAIAATTTIHLDPTCSPSGGNKCVTVDTAKYYKCSNTFTSDCSNYDVKYVTYTTSSGGSGTYSDPYVIGGCAHSNCLCNAGHYFATNKCESCPTGWFALPASAAGSYHKSTACTYCARDYYKSGSDCIRCPENGYSNTGSDITQCYLPTGWTGSDDTGTYTCNGQGFWRTE